ncbi:MAG: UDP-N-acetylmuramate dehydrogenase [candidate division NC10 bacterium]|nr:UDP-N-acetylmuramate dehydrogenase [candidate division NC10 bacterium]
MGRPEGELAGRLRRRLRGKVESHVPLARQTSFGVGGPARVVVSPADEADLLECLNLAASEGMPVLILGAGSNTLIRDGGFPGMVIRPDAFRMLERQGERITAGAGVRISRLLAFGAKQGLSGLEILTGVPGTVGGAVWGNAGAWGGAVGDRVVTVRIVRAAEGTMELPRAAIPFRYRASGLPAGAVITRATFGLVPGEGGDVRRCISAYLVQRSRKQPVEYRSAGSIFKNPPGDYAGRLVEAAGLKGSRIGNAQISEKHGNFIVNLGGARAADILALVELAKRRVREAAGVELELEMQVVGEDT